MVSFKTSVSKEIVSRDYFHYRVLIRNFGKMAFLRHLGKSVRLKAYSHTIRYIKLGLGSGGAVSSPAGPKQSPSHREKQPPEIFSVSLL